MEGEGRERKRKYCVTQRRTEITHVGTMKCRRPSVCVSVPVSYGISPSSPLFSTSSINASC